MSEDKGRQKNLKEKSKGYALRSKALTDDIQFFCSTRVGESEVFAKNSRISRSPLINNPKNPCNSSFILNSTTRETNSNSSGDNSIHNVQVFTPKETFPTEVII